MIIVVYSRIDVSQSGQNIRCTESKNLLEVQGPLRVHYIVSFSRVTEVSKQMLYILLLGKKLLSCNASLFISKLLIIIYFFENKTRKKAIYIYIHIYIYSHFFSTHNDYRKYSASLLCHVTHDFNKATLLL